MHDPVAQIGSQDALAQEASRDKTGPTIPKAPSAERSTLGRLVCCSAGGSKSGRIVPLSWGLPHTDGFIERFSSLVVLI
jgi:hypothetical protein